MNKYMVIFTIGKSVGTLVVSADSKKQAIDNVRKMFKHSITINGVNTIPKTKNQWSIV